MGGRYSHPLTVDTDTMAEVIAEETGIPVGTIREDEARKLMQLEEILSSRVLGQKEAIEKIANVVRLSRAGLNDSGRPMGVFLFLGPSGVGKTELTKALAEALFDTEDEMIRLDMSEYKEKHEIAKLIGAPPGYIGYEQEGQLTGALRRKPYSVVLFDEIEKAHPDIFDIFLQLFDEGRITDAKGQTVNAKNSIFILTSNIGTDLWYREPIGFVDPKSENGQNVMESIHGKLNQTFRTEFLNRLDEVLFFNFLGMDTILKLARKKIDDLKYKLKDKQKILFDISGSAIQFIAQKGYNPRFGARQLERAIQKFVIIPISEKINVREIVPGRNVILYAEEGKLVFRSNFETQ
jgi:ATP-dependent Clp protease ATP-binding subunit ClpA